MEDANLHAKDSHLPPCWKVLIQICPQETLVTWVEKINQLEVSTQAICLVELGEQVTVPRDLETGFAGVLSGC